MARIAEPPTLASLRKVVASYAAAMTADRQRGDSPVLYFAFSGHGARDRTGAAFLALLDGPLTQSVLYDEVLARLPTAYSQVKISGSGDFRCPTGTQGLRYDLAACDPHQVDASLTRCGIYRRWDASGQLVAEQLARGWLGHGERYHGRRNQPSLRGRTDLQLRRDLDPALVLLRLPARRSGPRVLRALRSTGRLRAAAGKEQWTSQGVP